MKLSCNKSSLFRFILVKRIFIKTRFWQSLSSYQTSGLAYIYKTQILYTIVLRDRPSTDSTIDRALHFFHFSIPWLYPTYTTSIFCLQSHIFVCMSFDILIMMFFRLFNRIDRPKREMKNSVTTQIFIFALTAQVWLVRSAFLMCTFCWHCQISSQNWW